MMKEQDRAEWLKTVKENDKVYDINYRYGSLIEVKEYSVKKITTSGKIRLNNDVLLDKDGMFYGGNFGANSIKIYPMCDDVQKAINKINTRNLWGKIKNKTEHLKLENLNYETLSKIDELLNEMYVEEEK